MIICGIKASHDGGIALIRDGRLLCCVEAEKVANGRRYSPLGSLARVEEFVRSQGFDPADIDRFVIDGWGGAPGTVEPSVDVAGSHGTYLPVAPYVDSAGGDVLQRYEFAPISFGSAARSRPYTSYHHASNHIMGAYCTSPFAQRREDALVVVWDGGMAPRAYHVDPGRREVRFVAELLPVVGNAFPAFCSQFEPFLWDGQNESREAFIRHHLEISGKAMAYAALGSEEEEAVKAIDALLADRRIAMSNVFDLGREVATEHRNSVFAGMSNADLIASFQSYLGRRLIESLARIVRARYPDRPPNLCFSGGCALNIKWNAGLRDSGLFREIWIPPFPNDSGAAIGTACCEMFLQTDSIALDWDVYQGPALVPSALPSGWTARPCDEKELAEVLHDEGEPVVVLTGRAELGPRALGSRSILAPAHDPAMKSRLNELKGRADYRPVAPMCLESRSAEVFSPGGRDPFMLFEHQLRPGWAERVPAVMHLDGTARLQTVDESSPHPIAAILSAYAELSGIPVLCNTSANFNGYGFFPDVRSAAEWGRTQYVWSDGTLYTCGPPEATSGTASTTSTA
ncbi:carbamoyltransferase N-terminal domain-containing protein [Streptomyces sp. NPDC048297]|uniref:carbamoyltransferase N-terminal domain-containing protein n=1 Tax=Streptomyces sp. NPDC048297 TaxID=3365531 RepID=UPI003710409A